MRTGLVLRTSRDRVVEAPTEERIRGEVEYLDRGGRLVLSCDGDAFAQVLLREDGVYVVEHGFAPAPLPGEVHYAALRSARTVSRDKVGAALGRWAGEDLDWAAGFDWSVRALATAAVRESEVPAVAVPAVAVAAGG